jgi:hypothetical protein
MALSLPSLTPSLGQVFLCSSLPPGDALSRGSSSRWALAIAARVVRLISSKEKSTCRRNKEGFSGQACWPIWQSREFEAFLNLVFAHEVAHFVPNYVHDPDNGRDTGPVVDAVNEIQQARGLLLRAQYGAFGRGSSGDFVSVEFGQAKTNRAGNIVRNKVGGIEVNRTNKTVTWVKRTVGGTGIN